MTSKQPMLATNIDWDKLRLPVLSSIKMDGIRCLVLPKDPFLWGRNGKAPPNKKLYSYFDEAICFCRENDIVLDGEIWSANITFQDILSYWSSHDKSVPDDCGLAFHCFDALFADEWTGDRTVPSFQTRYLRYTRLALPRVANVKQTLCYDRETIEAAFERILLEGGEGLILRDPTGTYKWGRSTVREGLMLKVKEFVTADAIITDTEPLTRHIGERSVDAFGRSKTNTRGDERETLEALGTLVVRTEGGDTLRIGSGFDFRGGDKDRTRLWRVRENLIGRWVEFKYMKCGMKEGGLPRFPIFLRFREDK